MANLKKCRACLKPVAQIAKVCPNCGMKRPGRFGGGKSSEEKLNNFYFWIIFSVLFIIICSQV